MRVEEVEEGDEVGAGGDVLLDEVGGFVGVGLGGLVCTFWWGESILLHSRRPRR